MDKMITDEMTGKEMTELDAALIVLRDAHRLPLSSEEKIEAWFISNAPTHPTFVKYLYKKQRLQKVKKFFGVK